MRDKSGYRHLLEHSFEVTNSLDQCGDNRLFYLSDFIFGFTTYDSGMAELFAGKAIETCSAINSGETFEYITDQENYKWFLLMCNMPFFVDKIEWGTSVRGAWWGATPRRHIELGSCGLWDGEEQITEPLRFSREEWESFVAAMIDFSRAG